MIDAARSTKREGFRGLSPKPGEKGGGHLTLLFRSDTTGAHSDIDN